MQKHPSMFLRFLRFFLGRRKDRADDARTTEETLKRAAERRERGDDASASKKTAATGKKPAAKTKPARTETTA